ncbi:MAG: 50S ribosomal protein L3 [Thermoleophilia bacterium]
MAAILGKKLGMTQIFTDDGDRIVVTVIEAGPCAVTQVKTNARDGYQAVQMGFGEMKKNKVIKPQAGHFKKAGVEPRRHLAEIRVEAEVAEGGSEEDAILKLVVPAAAAVAEEAAEEPAEEAAAEAAVEAAGPEEESTEAQAADAGEAEEAAEAAGKDEAEAKTEAKAEAKKEEKKSTKKSKKKAKTPEAKPEITVNAFETGQKVKVTGVSKGKGFAGVIKRHNFAGGPASHGAHFHRAPGSIGASAYPSRVFKGLKLPGQMGNKKSTQLGLTVVRIDQDQNLLFLKGAVPGSSNGLVFIQTQ